MNTKKAVDAICHPLRYLRFYLLRYPSVLSDRTYIETLWLKKMGYAIDLNHPRTYNEKLQWLKLNDHNPHYTALVDKLQVKDVVGQLIGQQYIIPTLGVWDKTDDISLESLPERFVLKTTHDSGSICICRDRATFDLEKAKRQLDRSLKNDYWLAGREWPYKDVPRRIIAEPYLEDTETGELRDYKFFCFGGEVKLMFIATDRQHREEPYFDFFDLDFNHIDMRHGHPNAPVPPAKPKGFDTMIELTRKIAGKMAQVRVDFYEVNGQVLFGEVTLFHHGGWMPFDPKEWDEKMGRWIQLPVAGPA